MDPFGIDMPRTATTDTLAPSEFLDGRLGRLRVRHLQLLDQIHKTGSLTSAAAVIGVSQPAATTMLREVEDAFGHDLIERSHRGGRLNPAGEQVLGRLRIALSALDAAKATLNMAEILPLVRVGVLPLVGIEALSSVVSRLEAAGRLPRIEVQIGTVGELLTMLSDGNVDCVVSGLEHDTSQCLMQRLRVSKLWKERLVVVASEHHRLARQGGIELEDMLAESWILTPASSSNRRSVERLFLKAGLIPPQARIEASSFHICLGLAATSRMLTVVPESAFRQYADRVVELRTTTTFESNSINLITLSDVPSMEVVGWLEAEFKRYAQALLRSK